MRNFYLAWPPKQIYQTASDKFPPGNNSNENDASLISPDASASPAATTLRTLRAVAFCDSRLRGNDDATDTGAKLDSNMRGGDTCGRD
jgi:hypothetical protein